MAFIYCKSCDWSQDDFWCKDGYTPFRKDIMDFLRDSLFKSSIETTDPFTGKREELDGREFVARELERKAAIIRNMLVRTEAEWMSTPKIACPECGMCDWEIE